MRIEPSIPAIDVAALFGDASRERDRADQAILNAANTVGFFVAHGFSPNLPIDGASRSQLLRLFKLPPSETRALWRQKFDPSHPNVYRGWFPLQAGHATYKEGIDMGRDVAYGSASVDAGDPLGETLGRGLFEGLRARALTAEEGAWSFAA